jgi:hypothetical protein
MRFEEKKFCKISTLAMRWDCSARTIYRLLERKILQPFHAEGILGTKGLKITVESVLMAEKRGLLQWADKDE